MKWMRLNVFAPALLLILAAGAAAHFVLSSPEANTIVIASDDVELPADVTVPDIAPLEQTVPAEWVDRGSCSLDIAVVDGGGSRVPPKFIEGVKLWRRVGVRWLECPVGYDYYEWSVQAGLGGRYGRDSLEPGDYILHVVSPSCGNAEVQLTLSPGEHRTDRIRLPHNPKAIRLDILDSSDQPVRWLLAPPALIFETPTPPTKLAPTPVIDLTAPDASYWDSYNYVYETSDGCWWIGVPKGHSLSVQIDYPDEDGERRQHEFVVENGNDAVTVRVNHRVSSSRPKGYDITGFRRALIAKEDQVRRPRYQPPKNPPDPRELKDLKRGHTRLIFRISSSIDVRPDIEILNADGST